MLRRVSLYIGLLGLFLLKVDPAFSTHLVGGFISYQYIAETAQGVQYRITITSYRDCKPGSVQFADDIDICIFTKDTRKLLKSQNFKISTRTKVQPVGRTDCPEATQVCLEKAIYTGVIVVPRSSFGYYVKWEVCCRNTQVNLRNGQNGDPDIGQTYQTEIPPTSVVNSSPFFTDVPVPFICVNDTTQLNNYAVDPDGDSLYYRLATPWIGASLTNNYPGCKEDYEPPIPISPQQYQTGYGGSFPFGPTGLSLINSTNGITTFLAKNVGNYAVAIDLLEFRNGKLLSTTRLDLQILVINCTPNNKPTISTSLKSYNINAGEKLCFNVTANDKDNNNVTLKGLGDILTGANGFKGNKAIFLPSSGKGTTSSQFCWQTSCDQGRTSPYLFTAQAIDDGCPSKFTFVNVSITVKPFTGKVSINGPGSACEGSKGNQYSMTTTANTPDELTGVTYEVTVTNGVLVSKTSNLLVVNWNKGVSTGKIEVTPISRFGCKGTPATFSVNLIPSPAKPVIPSVDTVCENTSKTYTTPLTNGFKYQWNVTNGSVLGSTTSNKIDITWGQPGKASAWLIQYSQNNCPSDTAYLNVWVSKPQTPGILGKKTVCPNTSGLIYTVASTDKGSTFKWFVSGGTIAGSSSSNSVTVNWGNQGTGFVKVLEINRFGCIGDTVRLPILKTYNLSGDSIQGDTDICEFTANQVFSVPNTVHSVYHWSITGGTINSGQGTNSVNVTWGANGAGSISMYETSYDSVNNKQCISNLVTRAVNIRPYPVANAIAGTLEVCQSSSTGVYSINGYPKSYFLWSINNDTSGISGQGTSTITISYAKAGTFNIRVIETTEYGCQGQPVNTVLIVHPKPHTTPIVGDSVICFPNLAGHKYTTTGLGTSQFYWFVDGGAPVAPSNINNITIDWSGKQINTIKVLEISDFGCPGDTVRLDVFYDHPSIYLNYITVNPPPKKDDGIDLYWTLFNAPRYNNQFFIERRKAGTTDAFTTVGSVAGNLVQFNNDNIFTDSNSWEYRVKGFDLCGQAFYTNMHTDILLKGFKPSGYSVSMNFTPYFGWGSSNIKYDLYRMLKNSGDYELYEANITSFNAAYSNGLEYYTQCYRVKATKIGTDTVTWSNDVCFNFDPIIFIPDAFSPNHDDFNDEFFVKGGALRTVEFKIYDRWGEKLFEGDNINSRWDGTYKGQDQPQGVYMFYCLYTGFDGRKYSTKGTITLLR